jgi:hypothetical protein
MGYFAWAEAKIERDTTKAAVRTLLRRRMGGGSRVRAAAGIGNRGRSAPETIRVLASLP